MKNEKEDVWSDGWDAYFNNEPSSSCPNYTEQKLRDEWMLGWLAAKEADFTYEDSTPNN